MTPTFWAVITRTHAGTTHAVRGPSYTQTARFSRGGALRVVDKVRARGGLVNCIVKVYLK